MPTNGVFFFDGLSCVAAGPFADHFVSLDSVDNNEGMCMVMRSLFLISAMALCFLIDASRLSAQNPDAAVAAEVRAQSDKLATAFNAGKADEVAAAFLANGELIDEKGKVYRGEEQIKQLLTAFFAKFPGTKMSNEIESVRLVGPIAIQEGTRIVTAKDGTVARIPYLAVLAKTDAGWRIASLRDFPDQTPPTSGDMLQPLDWLIGDWLNEGSDARVEISYRWSDDKNFILGEFSVTKGDNTVTKSSQRIGWDPVHGQPRSWIFDADGGYAEATWVQEGNKWVVSSSAVIPDGTTGSARLTITPGDNDRFVIAGTDRFVGGVLEDDYEITVVRKPPTSEK